LFGFGAGAKVEVREHHVAAFGGMPVIGHDFVTVGIFQRAVTSLLSPFLLARRRAMVAFLPLPLSSISVTGRPGRTAACDA